jgi:mannose-6-phosphate isomerase-like protein (cupin superfamily)
MKIRRVVTAHSDTGEAIIASDEQVEGIRPSLFPGIELHQLWGSDEAISYPDDGSARPCPTWFPPVGGFRFMHFVLPPDRDAEAEPAVGLEEGLAEIERQAPGLMDTMAPESHGMHRSRTTDFIYVVSGQAVCELGSGSRIRLEAGDTLIQSGTWHRWSNPGSEPCLIVGALVGARMGPG